MIQWIERNRFRSLSISLNLSGWLSDVTENKIPYLRILKYEQPPKQEIVHPDVPKNPTVIQGILF